MSIFLVCGIFGASSTGAAEASAAALKIVHKNLEADDAYKNLRNKVTTSKEAFERAISNAELRNMFLEYSRIDYPLRKLEKCQQKVSSYIYERDNCKSYIHNFKKNNPTFISEIDKLIELIDKLDDNILDNSNEMLQNKKEKIHSSRQSIQQASIPTELIELINKYFAIIDQIIDFRPSLDKAKANYNNYIYYTKLTFSGVFNGSYHKIKNELYDKIKGSMETNSIQLSFLESLSLSDAYYDAQKELDEYQRNLNTTSRIFK